jgi:hypothetical protein
MAFTEKINWLENKYRPAWWLRPFYKSEDIVLGGRSDGMVSKTDIVRVYTKRFSFIPVPEIDQDDQYFSVRSIDDHVRLKQLQFDQARKLRASCGKTY